MSDQYNKTSASPKVRKFARELGVDITNVKGSERLGMVTEKDLKEFVSYAEDAIKSYNIDKNKPIPTKM